MKILGLEMTQQLRVHVVPMEDWVPAPTWKLSSSQDKAARPPWQMKRMKLREGCPVRGGKGLSLSLLS